MCPVSRLLVVVLLLFLRIPLYFYNASSETISICASSVSSFHNTCCEDISACIDSVCLVVLMPVARISVSFYLMTVVISVCLYLVCF